jgi:hypothetical protein
MALESLTRDDLRASVAAGILTEAQAASLLAIGEARQGQRAALSAEDEPFELFRGFAEIFVSTGLVILMTGILLLGAAMGGPVLPILTAVMCWLFARYFTLRRRMALPSIVLVTGFAIGVSGTLALVIDPIFGGGPSDRLPIAVYAGLSLLALLVYFWRFRVPFTALLIGLCVAVLVFLAVDWVYPFAPFDWDLDMLFDLARGSGLPLATLVFGLIMLAAGLVCDMRDPHRLGRWSATGFWCHILAAPALVNTIALTAYNSGGTTGNLLLALALAIIALLALVIDRRSFLTAGIGYLALLIGWALEAGDSQMSLSLLLLILGAFLMAIGTWWTQIRARLMRLLPNFPGKDRLPPYAETP